MVRDRHDALPGKLSSNRSNPRSSVDDVWNGLRAEEAVVVIPELFVQFILFPMHQGIAT